MLRPDGWMIRQRTLGVYHHSSAVREARTPHANSLSRGLYCLHLIAVCIQSIVTVTMEVIRASVRIYATRCVRNRIQLKLPRTRHWVYDGLACPRPSL